MVLFGRGFNVLTELRGIVFAHFILILWFAQNRCVSLIFSHSLFFKIE